VFVAGREEKEEKEGKATGDGGSLQSE